ncbi:MAG: hypothetical protein QW115_01520 [Thermoplasmata archaeon]
MRKINGMIGALLLGVLLLLVPCASADPWEVGKTWAYKWEQDYSTSGSGSWGNASFSGTYNGKAVYAYYVKYTGTEGEYYKFDFHGVHYSWANVDATYQVTNPYPVSGHIKLQQKRIWIEFYGSFYLKEKNISSYYGEEHTVYAIYKLVYTVFSKEDVEYTADYHATYEYANQKYNVDATAEGKGSFNLSLTLEFENGLPFLPAETGNYYDSGSTKCTYSGHVKANINGKWSISTNYPGGDNVSGNVSINVDRDYSGDTSVYYYFSVSGTSVSRPGLLTNMGTKTLDRVGCHGWNGVPTISTRASENEIEIEECASDLVQTTSATYDAGTGYYSSETNTQYGNSKTATPDDVTKIISDPKSTYGSYTGTQTQQGSDFLLLLVIAIVVVAVVVAVVAVVIVRKKKKQPPAPQQMPAQEMPPQYPQQPVQQYQAPPQPQYPQAPQQPSQPQQPQPPTY